MKRIVFISLACLAALLGYILFDRFLLQASIEVKSNGASRIELFSKGGGKTLAKNGSSATFRVKPGDYLVVASGSGSARSAVIVGQRQKYTLSMPLKKPLEYSQVTNRAAKYLFFHNNELRFLDIERQRLFKASRDGSISEFAPGLTNVSEVQWDAAGNAVVKDTFTRLLYVSSAGKFSTLAGEMFSQYGGAAKFALDRASGTLVVAVKKDIYLMKSPSAKPTKLLSAFENSSVAIGGTKVVIFESADSTGGDEAPSEGPASEVIVYDLKSQKKYSLKVQATQVSISPSGQYAAFNNFPFIEVVDLASRSRQYIPSTSRFTEWGSNDSFVYSDDAGIWQHSLKQNYSRLIATTDALPVGLAFNAGQIFFSVNPAPGESRIFSAGSDSTNENLIRKLSENLPHSTSEYRIDFGSLGGEVTLTITTFASLNNPSQRPRFEANTRTFRQKALEYLKSQDIDSQNVTIKYVPQL